MDINLGLTADATGTVDVITATYSPAPTLVDKKILFLVSAGANTSTTPTFAPNGLTAHTITKLGGQPLIAGDIAAAGYVAILEYNLANTRWELLNPASLNDTSAVFITARNNTGSQINKGQVVYITGALGQNPTIALARSDAEATSFDIGVAYVDIPNNTSVQNNIAIAGLLTGIDTTAFADGDKLYLSSTVAGALQNTPPVSPNFGAFIGFVLHSHITLGKILISLDNTLISQNTTVGTSLISVPSNNVLNANLALKAPLASPTFTGTVTTPAIVVSSETASRIAQIDSSKNVVSLDTATYPDLTELSYVKGVTSSIQTQLDAKGYTIQCYQQNIAAPADVTTYYFGNQFTLVPAAGTKNYARVYIPKAGTIKAIYGVAAVTGTLGSAEDATVFFRLNDVTNTTISSTVKHNAINTAYSNTALSIAVVAGDFFEIGWTTPSWATNPTTCTQSIIIWIE